MLFLIYNICFKRQYNIFSGEYVNVIHFSIFSEFLSSVIIQKQITTAVYLVRLPKIRILKRNFESKVQKEKKTLA